MLATGAADGQLRLWDVTDPARPAQTATLPAGRLGRAEAVGAVAVTPDARLLAAAGRTISLWDLTEPVSPAPRAVWTHKRTVTAVEFVQDGTLLAADGGGDDRDNVLLWDITDPARPVRVAGLTPHPTTRLVVPSVRVTAIRYSRQRRLLVTASSCCITADQGVSTLVLDDGAVILWDLTEPAHPVRATLLRRVGGHGVPPLRRRTTPTETYMTGHHDNPTAVSISGDGRQLASGSVDATVQIWDIRNPDWPACIGILPHEQPVNAVAHSPDGHLLATAARATVLIWQLT
jgi:WD40 repeat protein